MTIHTSSTLHIPDTDGVPRHTPVVTLSDLPPASSLGAYSTYVAWAASIAVATAALTTPTPIRCNAT